MKSKLYFTIGLPRSGKSSLCDKWVRYKFDIMHGKPVDFNDACNTPNPRAIVCSDDIRIATCGCRYSQYAEELVHSIQGVMIRSLLSRGFDVIIDGTHTTSESIKRVLQMRACDYLYVDTSQNTCKKRAIETDQQDLCIVIDKMAENLLITTDSNILWADMSSPDFRKELHMAIIHLKNNLSYEFNDKLVIK